MDFPDIVFPLYYLLGIAGYAAVITFGFIIYFTDIKRYCPEAKVFVKARRKGFPVLCRTDIGSGDSAFLLGKKKNPDKDIAFSDDNLPGLMVDPSLLGETDAMHFVRGLNIFYYGSTQWMPLTTITALGFKTIKRVVSERYKDLSFLPMQEVTELLNTKSADLLVDCDTVIGRYSPNLVDSKTGEVVNDSRGNPILMTGGYLAEAITDLREELKITPIDTGLYAFQTAFIMNPISHLSQDLEQLKMLIELMLRAEYEKMLKMMPYVIMAMMLMGMVAIVIYILGNLVIK
jgi:hypothetical protein